jgi:LysM repeat protein
MRSEARTLYAAFSILLITIVGIVFLFWYFFQDQPPTTKPAPATAAISMKPILAETAVSPTNQPSQSTQTGTSYPIAQTHTVQSGQTLFSIANSYGISVEELAVANNITDPSHIQAGQELIILNHFTEPTPSSDSSQAAQPDNQPTGEPTPPPATSNSQPASLNGIPLDQIVVMPPNVLENTRTIYARGQTLGRNPHAFSKLGDSTVENDHFLSRFDVGPYNLGEYAYLQPVVDHFSGSFNRDSAAVRTGLHSWTTFDPIWADKTICQPNETVIACEFRLHNPSVLLIRLGSNDTGAPSLYDESMRQIVQYAIDNGVIPIIGTKADRNEGSNKNNDIVRQICADYQIPLWEFDPVAGTLPGRGLDVDNVHMTTFYAHDYTDPTAFTRGHAMHNLTALMVLDAMLNEVIESGE